MEYYTQVLILTFVIFVCSLGLIVYGFLRSDTISAVAGAITLVIAIFIAIMEKT